MIVVARALATVHIALAAHRSVRIAIALLTSTLPVETPCSTGALATAGSLGVGRTSASSSELIASQPGTVVRVTPFQARSTSVVAQLEVIGQTLVTLSPAHTWFACTLASGRIANTARRSNWTALALLTSVHIGLVQIPVARQALTAITAKCGGHARTVSFERAKINVSSSISQHHRSQQTCYRVTIGSQCTRLTAIAPVASILVQIVVHFKAPITPLTENARLTHALATFLVTLVRVLGPDWIAQARWTILVQVPVARSTKLTLVARVIGSALALAIGRVALFTVASARRAVARHTLATAGMAPEVGQTFVALPAARVVGTPVALACHTITVS